MGKGKVIVTGASKGIGEAIVRKYCEMGFDVVGCARDSSAFDSIEKAVQSSSGSLKLYSADMSQKEEIRAFADHCLEDDSAISCLVNNVGVFFPGSLLEEEEGALEKQMATNLYSAYYLTRFLAPKMLEVNSGHIFNICSTASIAAYPNGSSYSITKYALLGFSHNLREELKTQGIKVTAVLPGNTLTPSWGDTDIPEDRFIKASDVADSIYALHQLSPNTDVEEILIQPQYKA